MENMILDKTKLKQVTNSSKTAIKATMALGLRQRARAYTVLAQFKDQLIEMGEKIVDRDYMDYWRGLEAAGAGSLVVGRHGKPTRFEWYYSCREIAKFVIEGNIEMKPVVFKPSKRDRVQVKKDMGLKLAQTIQTAVNKDTAALVTKSERVIYSIQIRPDYVLEVNLPSDISPKELETVSKAFAQA